jgi:hypoxanthine phosphoribosyltransferase
VQKKFLLQTLKGEKVFLFIAKNYKGGGVYLMNKEISGIILTTEEIAVKVEDMAKEITCFYQQEKAEEVVVIGILRGAVIFLSDLVRHMGIPCRIDFMAVSSYGDKTQSSGSLRILKDITEDISGKHVLIVEDIIDTGLTYESLKSVLWVRNPKTLSFCAFLNKPSRRMVDVSPDFCGFEIPDEFVVGYGLDYAGRYRELPYIGILDPSVYRK